MCPADHYCLGGAADKQTCAMGHTSPIGSSLASSCQVKSESLSTESYFLIFEMTLGYSVETFTKEIQDKVKLAIASASAKGCSCVVVKEDVSFTSISANEGSRRAAGIVVGVKLRLDSEDVASMITQKRALSADSINRQLVKLGVQPITSVSEPMKVVEQAPVSYTHLTLPTKA